MPRRPAMAALLAVSLLLAPVAACGSGSDALEDASDTLFSCSLLVTNGTANDLVEFQWILVERRTSGDVVWGALGRTPNERWTPGKELTVVLGPNYAEVYDRSRLEWEVVFVDATDQRYGPYTVPLSECGDTAITVLPEDAG